jgi:hypothetical protein
MLYRNMQAICKLDPQFRLAILVSNSQMFFEKLSRGFPELFTREKPEFEGPFPLSFLKREYAIWCADDGDRSDVNEHFQSLGFPYFLWARPGAEVFSQQCLIMGPEVDYQALQKIYKVGSFPDKLYAVTVDGKEYYLGWVNPQGVEYSSQQDVTLFPAWLVDTES